MRKLNLYLLIIAYCCAINLQICSSQIGLSDSKNVNINATPRLQQQQQQQHQNKIGLAPSERQACKLTSTTGGSSRRFNSATLLVNGAANSQNISSLDLMVVDGSNAAGRRHSLSHLLLSPPVGQQNGLGVAENNKSLQITNTRLQQQQPLTYNPINLFKPEAVQQKPRSQVDTSERLRQIRQLLISHNFDGYLVGPNDEHGSEYVTDFDRRLRFISGFQGSNGYALILLDRAIFFTDGRYQLQADADLDCNWWLVVGQEPIGEVISWLKSQNLSQLRLAMDARLFSLAAFDYLDERLKQQPLESELNLISQDLVDIVWDSLDQGDSGNGASGGQQQRRRKRSDAQLQVYPLEFAGLVSWQDKVQQLASEMQRLNARHYVVSKLDDIAWLLNLRGSDIPMSPLFKSYLFISCWPVNLESPLTLKQQKVASVNSVEQLFDTVEMQKLLLTQHQQQQQQRQLINNNQFFIKLTLYVDLKKVNQQVREHLMLSNETSMRPPQLLSERKNIELELRDYDVFVADFREKFALAKTQPASAATTSTTLAAAGGGPTGAGAQTSSTAALLASQNRLQGKLLLDSQSNVAIHVLAKHYDDRMILVEPLIQRLKAVKTAAEVEGMRQAHWRDSLAIAMLLSQLELDLSSSNSELASQQSRFLSNNYNDYHNKGSPLRPKWTEQSAAKQLEYFRSLMDFNQGQSFDTISAYGANGAIVHYKPPSINDDDDDDKDEANTDAAAANREQPIGSDSTYLLDSGGQYLDGTTDITRTVHFGQPNEWQRETYTRVLMGAIDMMSLVFPGGAQMGPGKRLSDLMARRYLMELGLDYAHGTGHGIGAYSMVHEAPALIEHFAAQQQHSSKSASTTCSKNGQQQQQQTAVAAAIHNDPLALQANMFTSVEPGYYEPGQFGIRLENIVATQRYQLQQSHYHQDAGTFEGQQNTTNLSGGSAINNNNNNLLRFEPISLVPFEPKLIKFDLLSNKQKIWLNSYNLLTRVRMTQQINSYLLRLRHQRSIQTGGADFNTSTSTTSINTNGANLQSSSSSSSSSSIRITGTKNYLRANPERLQQILEQTHKWIMRKTELIPLDVPKHMLHSSKRRLNDSNNNNNNNNNNNSSTINLSAKTDGESQATSSISSSDDNSKLSPSTVNDEDLWSSMGSRPEGQRLILAYMAQLPFGDLEASQASGALLAGARSDLSQQQQQSSSVSAGEKCAGLECDLLLLEALNAAHSMDGSANKWRASSSSSSSSGQSATTTSNVDTTKNEDQDQNEMALINPSWSEQMMDLFQLSGASTTTGGAAQQQQRNWASLILANIWPLLGVCVILVGLIQFGLIYYACGSSSTSGSSSNRSQSSAGQQQQQQATAGSLWQATASGRRLVQLASNTRFGPVGAQQQQQQQQGRHSIEQQTDVV